MPYISEKIRYTEQQDKRRKLTSEQKDEIKHKYSTGFYSLNNLAKEYKVSKKTILLTVNPESKRKNDEHIRDHWREYAPIGEERNEIMRKYRHRKQQMYIDGKLEK